MIYLGIGLLMLVCGFRLLLGASYVYFGVGVYFDFGEYGSAFGVIFLVAGIFFIKVAFDSFKKMQ